MYSLNVAAKLANYEELLKAKKDKVNRLQAEISSLEAKAAKLRTVSKGGNPGLQELLAASSKAANLES